MFILFINDLIGELNNSGIKGIQISSNDPDVLTILYADDMANVGDTVRALQAQIDIIAKFCAGTNMKINLQKTKVIVFQNGGIVRYYEKCNFNGVAIETVTAYKCMCLFITPKLIWSYAKHNLAAQARKSIVCKSSVGYFVYPELFKLFDTMIKPILLYGSEIWGFKISDTIENVQDNFCKRFEITPKCIP